MKYKNRELIDNKNNDTELMCCVEFDNPKEDNEVIVDNLIDELIHLFKGYKYVIYIEAVTTGIIEVRCWAITFDKDGVDLLSDIYNKLINADFNTVKPNILIGIYIDGEDWFLREDGSEYNQDIVAYDDFLENIEY
jgi:hypothetical protein